MRRERYAPMPIERLLWSAGIVVGASLPHWPELGAWIPALLCVCVAWRLAAKVGGWPLPNKLTRIVLAFAAFSGVLLEYNTINGVTAGSALLIVMVALKFLESHTQRDQLVLMSIAYFLVFASLLYERGLLTAAYLLGFVWVTTVGLLQLGRRGDLLPSRPTARLAARLLLQAVPIMLALFLLFPRLPGPLWALPSDRSSATSGLSDTMSPGDITSLGLSDEVAFRVEFATRAPRADQLYWRGPVLSEFNGRTWSRPPGMRRDVRRTIAYGGEPTEYRVMLEPTHRGGLIALDMPETYASDRRRIVMGSDYQLRLFGIGSIDRSIDYRVTSYTAFAAREPLSPREQTRFATLPDGNPRTRALVRGWVAEGLTPPQIIERALDVFRNAEFFYTLTPPALGVDTADDFIFETREGFCEHYASAFAIMMRAAGIPARVVTGYQGGELNAFGNYYIIRQSDAHAWTEVWLGDRGWVRVDPVTAVAPERVELGSGRLLADREGGANALRRLPLVRGALLAWDTFNTYWNQWVLGFDPLLQRDLLRKLGFDRPDRTELLLLATAATAAILVLLTVYLAWTSHRERRTDPAAECFATFGRKLEKADVPPRRPAEGPAAYARRAQARLPARTGEIERILARYLAARYEPDPGGDALRELAELVKSFRPARA